MKSIEDQSVENSFVNMQISSDQTSSHASKSLPSALEIRVWIVNYLARLLEIEPYDIYTNVPFDSYGLDSSAAVGLTGDLGEWLECEVDPTVIYDYPSVDSLVDYLGSKSTDKD